MSDSQFRNTQGQDTVFFSSTPHIRYWRNGVIVVVCLIALGMLTKPVLRYLGGNSVRVSALQFSTVSRGDLVREATGFGRVVAARSPSLFAASSGVVHFIAEAGTLVNAGAVLAEIESPELVSVLAQEQSGLLAFKSDAARQGIANQRAALTKARELDTARIAQVARQHVVFRFDPKHGYFVKAVHRVITQNIAVGGNCKFSAVG